MLIFIYNRFFFSSSHRYSKIKPVTLCSLFLSMDTTVLSVFATNASVSSLWILRRTCCFSALVDQV